MHANPAKRAFVDSMLACIPLLLPYFPFNSETIQSACIEGLHAFPLLLPYFSFNSEATLREGRGWIFLYLASFVVGKMLEHEPFFRFSDTSRHRRPKADHLYSIVNRIKIKISIKE